MAGGGRTWHGGGGAGVPLRCDSVPLLSGGDWTDMQTDRRTITETSNIWRNLRPLRYPLAGSSFFTGGAGGVFPEYSLYFTV